MTMTDPIADMLARIRNGQQVGKDTISVPASRLKKSVLEVLMKEGYIRGFRDSAEGGHPSFDVELKYMNNKPVISEITRSSRPGLRQYVGVEGVPLVRNGLGIAILSTSQGVMSDAEARRRNLGGELLCTVF